MRSHSVSFHAFLTLGLLYALGCSGGRSDSLRQCTLDTDCGEGQRCTEGACVTETDSAVLSATFNAEASAEGANAVVLVESSGGECSESPCTVKSGATVTFTAPEVAGYRFRDWSGDDPGCTGDKLQITLEDVSSDVRCIAHYVRRLSVSGSVAGDADSAPTASSDAPFAECRGASCDVEAGDIVTLLAPERAGFRFDGWDGEGCDDAEGMRVSVSVVDADIACTAHYVPGFVVRGGAMGSLTSVIASSTSPNAQCNADTCQVDRGSDVTLRAAEVAGYRIAGWAGDPACQSSAAVLVLHDVAADLACVAQLVARHVVQASASGATPTLQVTSSGTFSRCEGARCEVDHGSPAYLLAGTAPGFRLVRWTGSPLCDGQVSSAIQLTSVDADVGCVAQYVQGVAVGGAAVGAPASVTASTGAASAVCQGASCVVDVGSDVTLSATSVTGYTFTGWTGDPECTSSAQTITLSGVQSSKTCFANYGTVRLTVAGNAEPAAGGAVRVTSSDATASCAAGDARCTVDYGGSASVAAAARTGYTFGSWSGCATGSTPSLALTGILENETCTASFSLNRYTVRVTAQPTAGGSVSTSCGSASCSVEHGGELTLTATENAGYSFTGWSGCTQAGSAPQLTFTGIDGPMTCTANFSRQSYAVTGRATPAEGGTVSCGDRPCVVEHGASQSLTAMPSAGYNFDGWSGCSTARDATITLSNISAAQTCTASFSRQTFRVTTSVAPAGGGTASCTEGCSVTYGQGQALTATPSAGFDFTGWSGCVTSASAAANLVDITRNQVCTASFARRVYRIATATNPSAGGSVTCSRAGCQVEHGSDITLTAQPATGFAFTGFSGCTGTASGASLTLTNVQGAQACTANFERMTFSVRTSVNPAGAGSVTCPGAGTCTAAYGDRVVLTQSPSSSAWVFDGFSGDCDAAGVVASVVGNVACVANYHAVTVTVPTAVLPAGAGTVTCAPAGCQGVLGTTSSVSAAPSAGYVFSGWSGCSTATTATTSVVLALQMPTCTANFARQQVTITTTVTPVARGVAATCNGAASCTASVGSKVQLGATAPSNYRFAGWTGCPGTLSSGTDPSAVLSDITGSGTCAARFVAQVVVTGGITSTPNSTPASTVNCGQGCRVDTGGTQVLRLSGPAGVTANSWTCNGAYFGFDGAPVYTDNQSCTRLSDTEWQCSTAIYRFTRTQLTLDRVTANVTCTVASLSIPAPPGAVGATGVLVPALPVYTPVTAVLP
jgi:hypothetical protein